MEEKLFYPSKIKWVLVGLFGLFFLAASLLSNSSSWYIILTGIVISGALMAISAFHLIRNVTFLKLNRNGFEVKSPFNNRKYKWDNVSGFEVHTHKVNYASQQIVVFTSGRKATLLSQAKTASKHDDYLPDNFGMKADELADILNEYRDSKVAKSKEA